MERLLDHMLRRPVAVQAFYAGLLLIAVYSLVRLPVALLPSLAYPSLAIWTAYPEAAPEKVERSVTEPLEEALAGVAELRRLESSNQLGGSLIRLDFGWNTDLDLASLEVRRQLDRLLSALPSRAERPLLFRLDPSRRPLMVLSLSPRQESGAEALAELKEGSAEVVLRRLEQIAGVARARLSGGHRRLIEVRMESQKLAAHGLEVEDLRRALEASNLELAGGMIRQGPFRYAVEVHGELASVDDVAAVVVSAADRPTVRLHQVATVDSTLAPRRGLMRLDGREILTILVERRSDSNAVETADEVHRAMAELSHQLPGVVLTAVVDESVLVRAALVGVARALIWGGVLAVAVLFLFLRRWRVLAAMAVSLPLSLALSLTLFSWLGVTLNLISLSGLALGIGMLVDNAIVVVEHISRLREGGCPPRLAASRGAAEVAPAITVSTLTTLAVFLPLASVEGLAGRLFRDQALAVVCSLLASLLVALTAVPLIAGGVSREGRRSPGGTGQRWLALGETWVAASLGHRRRVLALAGLLLVMAAGLVGSVRREVVPASEQGRVTVRLTLPTDAGLELVEQRSAELEKWLALWPGVVHVLADLGERDDARLEIDPRPPYEGELTALLAPGVTSTSLLEGLALWQGPRDLQIEARAVRSELEALLSRSTSDLMVELLGDRRAKIEAAVDPLIERLRRRPELANVMAARGQGVPTVRLEPRRDALLRHGVRPESLTHSLEAAARGVEASSLTTLGRDVPIRLVQPIHRGLEDLLAERVPSAAGLVPLSELLDARRVEVPAVLARRDRAPVAQVRVDIAPGASLSSATGAITESFAKLPAGVSGRLVGANETFHEGLVSVAWSLGLSVLLVYLLLAAQFESMVQPLVILTVVPLALAGVVPVLWSTGGSWNLMSLTGCVVLVGIAVNDAIVKVDFINRARRRGEPLDDAIRQAGRERVRPVLMTTATTVLGLLPLAVGWGAGAPLRAPMAVVIVGGLLFSTLITLTVVPVVYRTLVYRLDGGQADLPATALGEVP